MMGGGNAQVKDDFTFETTMAAGHARVTFFGGDWRVRSVRLDGADVTDAGFDVPPNGINGLVVELSARHADLSGTVVDANGAASRDYVVLIFPQNAEQWTRPNAVFAARPPVDGPSRSKCPAATITRPRWRSSTGCHSIQILSPSCAKVRSVCRSQTERRDRSS